MSKYHLQFDLEQQILNTWNIIDDLKLALELVEDNDEASNLIQGLITIYQMKFEKTFNTFERYIAEK